MSKFCRQSPICKQSQLGVTLVEMIIAIVIISVAAVALMQGLGQQTRNNVDPMIQSQANILAKQYLQEVSGKSFFDPSGDPRLDPTISLADANSAAKSSSHVDSSNRSLWDNLYEYHNYSASILDVDGTAISELSSYSVAISVDMSSSVSLGSNLNPDSVLLQNSSTTDCPPIIARIDITITDPRGQNTLLSGYRASYWDPGC